MNKKLSQLLTALICSLTISSLSSCSDNDDNNKSPEEDASQFVVLSDVIPDVILEIRYYSTYNFIGRRIPGYDEPIAMLTRQAADSLKKVSDDLVQQGYRLKIFDGYRPQKAVDYFMEWAVDVNDTLMKKYFYPELNKEVLVPQEYIAENQDTLAEAPSTSHSST